MPTIDDLLKSFTNTETQAICSTDTLSTSSEENAMVRFHDLLNELKNAFESVADEQKTYKGIKRSKLKDKEKLELEMIKKKLKQIKASMPFNLGDNVVNTNPNCVHYGSKGKVCGIEKLPDEVGEIVAYLTTNEGQNWKMGDILKKTANQLSLEDENEDENEEEVEEEENYEEMDGYKQSYYDMSVGSLRAIMSHAKDILDYLDSPMVKENLTAPHLQGMIAVAEDHMRSIHDFVMFVETDDDEYEEEEEEEETESKAEPVKTVKKRKKVKISDLPHYEYQFKKYPGVTTTMGQNNRPGLWENIRKKKEREGKKYRPAQPGDKDRPDVKQWKNLTK